MGTSSQFDYELLNGQRVESIIGLGVDSGKAGLNAEQVAICLERETLLISVNPSTDEIVLESSSDRDTLLGPARRWVSVASLSQYVGNELGWSWMARNYRGYSDLFILSFDVLTPQIAFCGAATSLWIYEMRKI
jgi:hypothetical protein